MNCSHRQRPASLAPIAAAERQFRPKLSPKSLSRSRSGGTGQFLVSLEDSSVTLGNENFSLCPGVVEDLDIVGFAGVGGHAPSTGFVRALAERFEASEALMTPKQLTLLAPGGETTLDPLLEPPGLVAKLFTSHLGAHPAAAARMAAPPTGNVAALEVHVLPRGAFSLCVARMATDGANSYACAAGVGTAVYDPRCGGGTARTAGVKDEYVRCEEDGSLRYFAPLPTVAVVNAAAADAKGNVYARGASAPADAAELAAAAALHGGRVVAVVAFVVPEGYGPILVPAARVSAVVVDRTLEQGFGALHVAPWPFLVAPDADADAAAAGGWSAAASDRVDAAAAAAARALGGRRLAGAADALVGAAVAKLTALCARRGGRVFVGAQLGAAGAALAPLTRSGDLELLSDGGAIGGAYSAAFAGAALDPKEVGSSAEVYRRMYDRLDVAVVRVARVDASGDAAADGGAAAARGGGAPYASSGVAEAAELASIVLLVCDFEEAATVRRDKTSGALAVRRRGAPNFVASLADAGDAVAFSARARCATASRSSSSRASASSRSCRTASPSARRPPSSSSPSTRGSTRRRTSSTPRPRRSTCPAATPRTSRCWAGRSPTPRIRSSSTASSRSTWGRRSARRGGCRR